MKWLETVQLLNIFFLISLVSRSLSYAHYSLECTKDNRQGNNCLSVIIFHIAFQLWILGPIFICNCRNDKSLIRGLKSAYFRCQMHENGFLCYTYTQLVFMSMLKLYIDRQISVWWNIYIYIYVRLNLINHLVSFIPSQICLYFSN